MKHFAILDSSDYVSSVHLSALDDVPATGAGLRPLEITAELAREIADTGLQHDHVAPRWALVGETIQEIADPRAVLTVTARKRYDLGEPVAIEFEYSEPVADLTILLTHDGRPRRIALRLVDGRAHVERTLEIGHYSIGSADEGRYRVDGDRSFEVAEVW